jgi:small neutral amino acid transporter SnatA (MarC family)
VTSAIIVPLLATLLAFAVVWLALVSAAPLIALAGLGELDLLLRAGLVFVALGLFERLAQRLLAHRPSS